MALLSFVVRDVVIVGQPNSAEQLHASQPSPTETAVQMEAAQGESPSVYADFKYVSDVLITKQQLLSQVYKESPRPVRDTFYCLNSNI